VQRSSRCADITQNELHTGSGAVLRLQLHCGRHDGPSDSRLLPNETRGSQSNQAVDPTEAGAGCQQRLRVLQRLHPAAQQACASSLHVLLVADRILVHRGKIIAFERAPSAGVVSMDHSRRAILWGLGDRFTAQNQEVTLPVTVTFDAILDPTLDEDKFCSGDTGYIEVCLVCQLIEPKHAWFASSTVTALCWRRYTLRFSSTAPAA
jgi:hypothetical protein